MVEALTGDQTHKYLGRRMRGSVHELGTDPCKGSAGTDRGDLPPSYTLERKQERKKLRK